MRRKPYLFTGFDKEGYRDYLDFSEGKYLTLEKGGGEEAAHVRIPACSENREKEKTRILNGAFEERVSCDAKTGKKRAEFLKVHKRTGVWNFYGSTDIFERWNEDVWGNHINKAYFEEKYVRDILQTEPDPVLFHLFLMESEADRVIHLFDGETWDKIHQKWDEGISFILSYVYNLSGEGELLPMVPVRIGVVGETEYPVESPCSWIRSLEVEQFDSYAALLELAGEPVAEKYVNPDFEALGENILKFVRKGTESWDRLYNGIFILPEACRKLHEKLQELLPYEITGETMDFRGLVHILRLLRNATRGHGTIQEDQAAVLWNLLLYYSLMCGSFLNLKNFGLYVSDGRVFAGYENNYENGYREMSDYFMADGNVPCILWEAKKKIRRYINYFYGNYVVPDYFEV